MKSKLVILLAMAVLTFTNAWAQNAQSLAVQAPGKISLEVKGMDTVDVLKMLATRSGFNIAIGKNVTGKVTVFLKDVEFWDALEIILLSNNLAYETRGNIITVITDRDYELAHGEQYQDKKQIRTIRLKHTRAQDLAKTLGQIKTGMGKVVVDDSSNSLVLIDSPLTLGRMEEFVKQADQPLKTQVFELNYAQSDKLAPKIQEITTKGIGSAKFDDRTNKVVITDYPQKVEEIARIISAFDEKSPQVLIDSQIIQITPQDKFEMGVDWNFWITKYFEIQTGLPISLANDRLFLGTLATGDPKKPKQFSAVIDLLQTIGDTKILSSPRIMTLNNQEAKIHIGTKEAYITSTTSQAGTGSTVVSQSVNFVETGIQLSVTPIISRNGFVTMKIKPEISEAVTKDILSEDTKTSVPIVTSSEAQTTVTVKDGVTIIIGGLKKESREKTVKKIPFLGDLPLLGALFRSTSDDLTSNELVILLTPHIMTGEAPFTDISQAQPSSGAVARMEGGRIILDKTYPPAGHPDADFQGAYLDYYTLLKEKITNFARSNPDPNLKGEVEISFIISANGSLAAEPLIVKNMSRAWRHLPKTP